MPGDKCGRFCKAHKTPEMVDVVNRGLLCKETDCKYRASYAVPGNKATHCLRHQKPGEENVNVKRCAFEGCNRQAIFGEPVQGGKRGETHCVNHKTSTMVDVCNPRCVFPGCKTRAIYAKPGDKPSVCFLHKTEGMEDIHNILKRCTEPGCMTRSCCGTTAKPRMFCSPHALAFWIENAVPLPNRVSSLGKMPTAKRSYSRNSIECLDWHATQLGLSIQHAETGVGVDTDEILGEHLIQVPGHRWKADGFTQTGDQKIAWEFHGCLYHGCPKCFKNRDKIVYGKTMEERLQTTHARAAEIAANGYTVIQVWECDWNAMVEDEDARSSHLNAVRRQLGQAPIAPKRKAGRIDDYFVVEK